MNNQPIGILDSGIGGLSIWKEITLKLPDESTIYLADSANCPYGDRVEGDIYNLSQRLVRFLLERQVKLVVIACNTITVSCLDKLRLDFPQIPIIGTVPVVKTASEKTKNKKIGILSTLRTSKSAYQKRLIETFAPECEVVNVGTDKLVPHIENSTEDGNLNKILKEELQSFLNKNVDVIALGCSHFPLIKGKIQEILGPDILLLDSGAAIARQVERVLMNNNALSGEKNTDHAFYTTGNLEQFKSMIKRIAGAKSLIERIEL